VEWLTASRWLARLPVSDKPGDMTSIQTRQLGTSHNTLSKGVDLFAGWPESRQENPCGDRKASFGISRPFRFGAALLEASQLLGFQTAPERRAIS